VVLYHGRETGELAEGELTESNIMVLATGGNVGMIRGEKEGAVGK